LWYRHIRVLVNFFELRLLTRGADHIYRTVWILKDTAGVYKAVAELHDRGMRQVDLLVVGLDECWQGSATPARLDACAAAVTRGLSSALVTVHAALPLMTDCARPNHASDPAPLGRRARAPALRGVVRPPVVPADPSGTSAVDPGVVHVGPSTSFVSVRTQPVPGVLGPKVLVYRRRPRACQSVKEAISEACGSALETFGHALAMELAGRVEVQVVCARTGDRGAWPPHEQAACLMASVTSQKKVVNIGPSGSAPARVGEQARRSQAGTSGRGEAPNGDPGRQGPNQGTPPLPSPASRDEGAKGFLLWDAPSWLLAPTKPAVWAQAWSSMGLGSGKAPTPPPPHLGHLITQASRRQCFHRADWDNPLRNNEGRPLCLLVGADRPLGRAAARAVGASYDVLGIGHDVRALTYASADLINAGVDNRCLRADLSTYEGMMGSMKDVSEAMAAMQHDHVGAVLYLEHVTFAGLFEEMSLQHLLLCIRVNMLAPMMTSIMLLQSGRLEEGARVVMLSDIAARAPSLGASRAAFAACKTGLVHFARGVRQAGQAGVMAARRAHFVVVEPGLVDVRLDAKEAHEAMAAAVAKAAATHRFWPARWIGRRVPIRRPKAHVPVGLHARLGTCAPFSFVRWLVPTEGYRPWEEEEGGESPAQ